MLVSRMIWTPCIVGYEEFVHSTFKYNLHNCEYHVWKHVIIILTVDKCTWKIYFIGIELTSAHTVFTQY